MKGPAPKNYRAKILSGSRHVTEGKEPPQLSTILPPCPPFLTGVAKRKWSELSAVLFEMNTLTSADVQPLGVLCQALAVCEEAGARLAKEGSITPDGRKNPAFAAWKEAALVAAKYSEKFGLDPVSRERLKVQPKPQESDFEKYLREA